MPFSFQARTRTAEWTFGHGSDGSGGIVLAIDESGAAVSDRQDAFAVQFLFKGLRVGQGRVEAADAVETRLLASTEADPLLLYSCSTRSTCASVTEVGKFCAKTTAARAERATKVFIVG
jgi:hypothetical protein